MVILEIKTSVIQPKITMPKYELTDNSRAKLHGNIAVHLQVAQPRGHGTSKH